MVDCPALTIHLLGGFRFAAGDKRVASLDHARLQELAAYLLLQRGSLASRQHLAFRFWPDSTEKQARTNLRNLWHRLRRTLPEAERLLAEDVQQRKIGQTGCRDARTDQHEAHQQPEDHDDQDRRIARPRHYCAFNQHHGHEDEERPPKLIEKLEMIARVL
ncbi:MAG: hypothetical protein R6W76_09705, partial [Caldilinea sp.]